MGKASNNKLHPASPIVLILLYILILFTSGDFVTFIFVGGIGLLCAHLTVKEAVAKNKNQNIAFFVGGIFGILGYLLYLWFA